PPFISFFIQVEDGIRDRNVTGVQTCALPILEKLVDPIRGETIVVPADEKTVSVTPSLQEILSRLAQYDQLTVERDGKIIGKINRRVVLQYLADHLYERGAQDG